MTAEKYDPDATRRINYVLLTPPAMIRLRRLISSRSRPRVAPGVEARNEIETSASFPEAAASSLCRRARPYRETAERSVSLPFSPSLGEREGRAPRPTR